MIAVINYNMGNLRSVENAFSKIGKKVDIVSNPDKLKNYDRVILPGVGAFGDAMEHLKENGMDSSIKEFAKSGKPLLGICLGMQLLLDDSDEFGSYDGLGLIEGYVRKFDTTKFQTPLKVPHMGWNELFVKKPSSLFKNLDDEIYLYFVHSYHAICDQKYILGETEYGYKFASAINKDNIYGFQPHPEKSHDRGLQILKNFTELT
jgi:glutamine amidotransferase